MINYTSYINAHDHPNSVLALNDLNAPASTVLLAEESGVTADVTNAAETASTDFQFDYAFSGGAMFGDPTFFSRGNKTYHTEGSNFLAADGHVKWLRPASFSSGAMCLKNM